MGKQSRHTSVGDFAGIIRVVIPSDGAALRDWSLIPQRRGQMRPTARDNRPTVAAIVHHTPRDRRTNASAVGHLSNAFYSVAVRMIAREKDCHIRPQWKRCQMPADWEILIAAAMSPTRSGDAMEIIGATGRHSGMVALHVTEALRERANRRNAVGFSRMAIGACANGIAATLAHSVRQGHAAGGGGAGDSLGCLL